MASGGSADDVAGAVGVPPPDDAQGDVGDISGGGGNAGAGGDAEMTWSSFVPSEENGSVGDYLGKKMMEGGYKFLMTRGVGKLFNVPSAGAIYSVIPYMTIFSLWTRKKRAGSKYSLESVIVEGQRVLHSGRNDDTGYADQVIHKTHFTFKGQEWVIHFEGGGRDPDRDEKYVIICLESED